MGKKLNITDMQKLAKKRGGKCLSDKYTSIYDKLLWKCEHNHTWEASANNVKNNHTWCPYCNKSRPVSIEDIKILAKERGGICLSEQYINNSTKMEFKCKYGHIWESTANNIKGGKWCPVCSKNYFREEKCRYILENLLDKKFTKRRNILSNNFELDGYCENLNLAFEYQGEQHYKKINMFKDTDEDLIKRKHHDKIKFDECERLNITLIIIPYTKAANDNTLLKFIVDELNKNNIKYDDNILKNFEFNTFYNTLPEFIKLKNIINSKGGTLLSNFYNDSNTILTIKCEKGHIWDTKAKNIKRDRWCPTCKINKLINSRRNNIEAIKEFARSKDGECLSNNYVNNREKLLWKCLKGHTWEASAHSILRGSWCPVCNNNKKGSIEEMRDLAESKKGTCLSDKYINARTKLKWKCKRQHVWEQTPYEIKKGKWCPICKNQGLHADYTKED